MQLKTKSLKIGQIAFLLVAEVWAMADSSGGLVEKLESAGKLPEGQQNADAGESDEQPEESRAHVERAQTDKWQTT